MRLGNKIFTGYILIIALIIAIGTAAYLDFNKNLPQALSKIKESSDELIDLSDSHELAHSIKYYDEVLTQSARNYAYTGDLKWRERYTSNEPILDSLIKQAMQKNDETVRNLFLSVDEANIMLIGLEYQSLRLVDEGMNEDAQNLLESEEYLLHKGRYTQALQSFFDFTEQQEKVSLQKSLQITGLASAQLKKIESTGRKEILIFAILSLISSLLLGILLSRKISNSAIELKEYADALGHGENREPPISGNDEFSEVADSIKNMAKKLKEYRESKLIHEQKSKKALEKEVTGKTSELNKTISSLEQSKAAMLNLLEDLSEAKDGLEKSREKYRSLIENLKDNYFFYSHNTKGVFTYLSPSIKNVLGYNPKKFLKHFSTYLTDNPINKKVAEYTEKSIKGIKQPPYKVECMHKNKKRVLLEVTEVPVTDQKGKVIAIEGIAHDITARAELEQAKSDFLNMISHELKTPLTPIQANLDLLHDGDFGKLSKKQLERLEIITRNAERLKGVISNLLEITRIESGNLVLNKQKSKLNSIAKEVFEDVEQSARDKKLKARFSQGKLPDILIDRDRIKECISNYMNNSLKFTEKGKIILKTEKTKNFIKVSVTDTGEGIDEKEQSKIFEKFYQIGKTETGKAKGVGLGLYSVKKLIEAHNGQVGVESAPGKGATFWFTLPLKGGKQ